MVTLTEGEQPLEQYEMVLFICNSFLPQLGYLMPDNVLLVSLRLGSIDFRHLKSRKCKFNNVVSRAA